MHYQLVQEKRLWYYLHFVFDFFNISYVKYSLHFARNVDLIGFSRGKSLSLIFLTCMRQILNKNREKRHTFCHL